MTITMQLISTRFRLFGLFAIAMTLACAGGNAFAQNVVALVNDEPITNYDVAQRQRWLARTNGFGDRMKAALSGDGIKERFKQKMIAANPRSEAEAKVVAERVKKELVEEAKRQVLNDGGSNVKKAALEAIIEDKLKLQAAKTNKINITDAEVEETLGQRTGGGTGKVDLTEFYKQFENDGIGKKTVKDIIRAQLAWRDLIRRQYGPRIASLMANPSIPEKKVDDADVQFDVKVLHLTIAAGGDDKAVSRRILEAENLKEKFTTCANLPKQAQLVPDATVKSMEKVKLASFPKDVQPLISKALEGQMTPPAQVGNAIESYAICHKAMAANPKAKPDEKPDIRQQEYERFSKRYLQELKQAASIDYRGT